MRVLMSVLDKRLERPKLLSEHADSICLEFLCSRATAFRMARLATDVARVAVLEGKERARRLSEKADEAYFRAKLIGWPNGKPGGENGHSKRTKKRTVKP